MDQDLDALRRRAFSRDATEEDLRALARVEPRVLPDTSPAEGAEPGPRVAEDATAPTRPSLRWPVFVAAGAGLAVGILIGVTASSAPTYPPDDSLRVFDRPAADPPEDLAIAVEDIFPLAEAEVRYLGEVGDAYVFASRATLRSGHGHVCLALVEGVGVGMACGTEHGFRQSGISLYSEDAAVGWGPVGDELWTPPPIERGGVLG